jgi:hypothetical protein
LALILARHQAQSSSGIHLVQSSQPSPAPWWFAASFSQLLLIAAGYQSLPVAI